MGNCLVTKSKGVVDNSDLLKINEFRFNSAVFRVESVDSQAEFNILSDNTFTNDTKTKVAQYVDDHDLAEAKETTISVSNKWDIYSISLIVSGGKEIDLTSLSLSQNLNAVDIQGSDALDALTILRGAKNLIYGSPSIVAFRYILLDGKPTLADLITEVNNKITSFGLRDMLSTCMTHVPDELTELAKLTACTHYDWWNNDLDGDIEEFVAASRAYGRTTGSINVNIHPFTHVRFQGQVVTGKVETEDPDIVFSWTENTITWNGVTINA